MIETQVASALDAFTAQLRAVAPDGPTTITIGKFDGVHVGHQDLIHTTVRAAAEHGATPGVITFDPLPYVAFNPGKPYHYLGTIQERVERIRDHGAAFVIVVPFSRAFAQISAKEFLTVLRTELDMVQLISGPDGAIGHGREGTIDRLSELGSELGYGVTQVTFVLVRNQQINSSLIRHWLRDEGNVVAAAQGLGRPYRLGGTVIGGDQRGRELGFPTANLAEPDHLIVPADGIYGGVATVHGERYRAAISIGVRPTFGNQLERRIEAFLLDFSGDLYGSTLTLDFAHRVRGEERFESVEALIDQMNRDVAQVRSRVQL